MDNVHTPSTFGAMASFLVPKLPGGLAGSLSNERSSISFDQSKLTKRERQSVRPPVEHEWSLPGVSHSTKLPEIFQHELIQNFSFNMFCKVTHRFLLICLFTSLNNYTCNFMSLINSIYCEIFLLFRFLPVLTSDACNLEVPSLFFCACEVSRKKKGWHDT